MSNMRTRQNNHPKQHSKLPNTQLDFGYIKGFDDSNVHAILTAIDIQSGMIMAIQLTDKRMMLFNNAVTQLQHFLRKNNAHTPEQEDFLTALTTAVAKHVVGRKGTKMGTNKPVRKTKKSHVNIREVKVHMGRNGNITTKKLRSAQFTITRE